MSCQLVVDVVQPLRWHSLAKRTMVAVSDQNSQALDDAVSHIRAAGGASHGFQTDLADLESMSAMVEDVRRTIGDPHILINNSGGPLPSLTADVAPQQRRNQFDSIVVSLMHLTDLLLRAMKQRRLKQRRA
ncbi:hypothetical protein R75777_07523 [Paraburkholderia nemoris]|nr:hypothetical protein R75777_07523 [Paraburkholderia nemoris]